MAKDPTRRGSYGLTLAWRGLLKLKHFPGLLLDLPLSHTLTASLLWTAGILVVFAPLAVRSYHRQA